MNEFDHLTKKRTPRPRHQDAVWMACFQAALTGCAANRTATPGEVVERAMTIADEACNAARSDAVARITDFHQPPRDRNYLPGHIGTVKPAKT